MVEAIIDFIFAQYSPRARITTASRIKHRLHLPQPQPQPHSLHFVPVLGTDVPDVISPIHHSSLPHLPSDLIHPSTLPPPPMLDFVFSNTEHTPTTPVSQSPSFWTTPRAGKISRRSQKGGRPEGSDEQHAKIQVPNVDICTGVAM